MNITLRFPSVLDSTTLNSWRQCQRQALYSRFLVVEPELDVAGIKPQGLSIDLHAGGAFARGLETTRRAYFEQGCPEEQAIILGLDALLVAYGNPEIRKDTPKTWDRMLAAFVAYFDEYPLASDAIQPACYNGKWAVEFSFAVPLDMWDFYHPETGEPLLLAGRSDMIGTFRNSDFIVDEKTTSYLGESWSRKWDLRAQFLCYMWAARLHGFAIAGTIVRGVAIKKTSIDFAQALIRRNDRLLDLWEWQTRQTIAGMLDTYNRTLQVGEPQFQYNLGESCESYGGCPFKDLCLVPEESLDSYIRTDYEANTWNPLSR